MPRTFIAIRDIPSDQQRRWMVVAGLFALVGYGISLAFQLAEGTGVTRFNIGEIAVLVAASLALWAGLHHRVRMAAWLLVGSVWLELMTALVQSEVGLARPTIIAFAPLALGVGLL
ncbi:MAG: hypothetical protein JRI25_06460, partial [Deltaproteobacteria bacterium]|nr:hypothetical protein [Deltaproteobacteria bacterium]